MWVSGMLWISSGLFLLLTSCPIWNVSVCEQNLFYSVDVSNPHMELPVPNVSVYSLGMVNYYIYGNIK